MFIQGNQQHVKPHYRGLKGRETATDGPVVHPQVHPLGLYSRYIGLCVPEGRARMIPVQQQMKKKMDYTLIDTGPHVMLVCVYVCVCVCVCVRAHSGVSNSAIPWPVAC